MPSRRSSLKIDTDSSPGNPVFQPATPAPATRVHRYWSRTEECMDRGRLRDLQWDHLQRVVRRAFDHLPIYREKMNQAKVRPEDLKSIEDIRLLPFTEKTDFMRAYPKGMLAVPLKEIVRIHGSSGTTFGKSTIVGYTRHDLEIWTELCARLVTAAGVTADDIAQVAFGYGLFTGGFGLHQGLERVGAAVIPLSGGQTERQLQFMKDFEVTTFICTPSYAMLLAESVEKGQGGVKRADLRLRWGLFGAEPWTDAARAKIEAGLGLLATDNYGLSELCGPGVSYECLDRCGLHLSEDHFYAEIIDPATKEPVEEGEVGELVLTSLTREAVPLIRYRTRDLTRLTSKPCSCGRKVARMSKVLGRTDDMIIVRGVNVFPSQIESVLFQMEHTAPHFQIVLGRKGAMDTLCVRVEVREEIFRDEMRQLRAIQEEIRERLRAAIGISMDVELVEPRSIERFVGKAKRVVDQRGSQ